MINLLDRYNEEELSLIEIKHLDLDRQTWGFSRGAKTTRDYLYENGNVAVKISYTYTMANEDREVSEVLRHMDFYDGDGNIFLTKDITKPMNITQLDELNEDIRKGRVSYLRQAAIDLPQFSPFVPEPYKSDFLKGPEAVELLSNYYGDHMRAYEDDNSMEFEDCIKNESNHFMLQVLNLNVRPPDALFPTGLTIKQSILHQLTGTY